ncbi:metal ABC transporter permease [Caproiciproducens galactitolivorans]|uniref:High-affinity zinc uptake system membrane protein ZnuB n=1 Tax=Caproiciproducens galactitolivorans TaxID=642589 RepID=A0A4Z0YIM7_9FIRM|nr:metal ABC transporter permease [Caproiciproducens galactitolivorans]QEY35733.1 metal ABC transporter permease [Caproiciproducens galactitolivorans]TGJ77466.1 high-affinity zinc uptake system membrane protein ZnuB [Caproiciproducens galactitolivorans]
MSVIYSLIGLLLPFEWTEFSYMKNALLAVLLITPLFGLVGVMIVNNKMSFFSDALGHSALTGIAIGVLMGVDNYLVSMMGFSLLFALCISAVMKSETSSADTIIGVFSSTGLALGIVLLSASGGFAKYSGYLIGDILTVQPEEIRMLALILAAVVLLWGFFFNKLMLVSMNTDLAASKGIRVRLVEKFFVILVAVIVTVSIKWVGVLIINSLLVLPAASARNLAKSMRSYHFTAIGISLFSGVSGLIISYYAGTAAGGTIVLVAAVIFFITYFLNQARAKS